MPSVTTSSQFLCTGPAQIQNLGSSDLYVADVNPATTNNGVKVANGKSLVVGGGEDYYAISVGTSDVRVLARASGVFA